MLRLAAATLLLTTLPLAAQSRRPAHAPAAAEPGAIHNVFWQPNDVHQGSPLFLTVELDRPATRVTGTVAGKTITFFHLPGELKTFRALAGIDLPTDPGPTDLVVTATVGGRLSRKTLPITVAAGDFKTGDITVPDNYVNPSPTEQKQIAADTVLKDRAYGHSAPHLLWSGDFVKPVAAAPTPSFGEARILNEEKTSLHTGTDYPVPEGTAVAAANSGTVTLTRDLFYEGNTVIVDHGMGLFTVYLHLSRIDVKEGDHVTKGQKLGLSGASGRVTGPHVHFAVRWNAAWLDPIQVLALSLPKTDAPAAEPARGNKAKR